MYDAGEPLLDVLESECHMRQSRIRYSTHITATVFDNTILIGIKNCTHRIHSTLSIVEISLGELA